MHEKSITVERDGQHFLESSDEPGKILEGPFLSADEAEEAGQARDDLNQRQQSTPPPQASVPSPDQPIPATPLPEDAPPDPQEFLDAAVVIAGPDLETAVASKINAINLETGRQPHEIVQDAQADPSILDDLVSDRTPLPRAYGGIPDPIIPPEKRGVVPDIGLGVLFGIDSAVDELFKTLGLQELGEFLDAHDPEFFKNIPKPETLAGQIAAPLVQGTIAMVPVARAVRAIGVVSGFLQWTIAGGFADFAAFAPDEIGLGELARDLGKLDDDLLEGIRSTLADALAKDEDDTVLEKRLKNMAGGAIIGSTLDGLMVLYRGGRAAMSVAQQAGLDPLLLGAGGLAVMFGELFGVDEAQAGGTAQLLRILAKKVMVDNPKRIRATGQFVGAPRGVNTIAKLSGLRRRLDNLRVTTETANPMAKFWYERSGKSILELVGGDIDRADKFVQVLAVLSRGNPVQNNLEATFRAFDQFNVGDIISAGRFPNKDRAEILGILDGTGDVTGLKRKAFYANLMSEIDPTRVPAGAVTVDVWMMRAFGFKTKSGGQVTGASITPQQNAFVQIEIKRIADLNGWEPHQVQAAIWVGQKAKEEGKGILAASLDFSDGLEFTRAQISWEAMPTPEIDHLRGLLTLPPQVKADYHQKASSAFLDDTGRDMLADALGLFSPGHFEAPGAFKGKVGPGEQTLMQVGARISSPAGERLDPATLLLVNVYAGARAAMLRQESIAWGRPIFKTTLEEADGIMFKGRALNEAETLRLYTAVMARGGDIDWAPISTPSGVRFLNFTDVPHKEFREKITEAMEAADLPPEFQGEGIVFHNEGDYLKNLDMKGDPDGTFLSTIAGRAGRPDLQRRVDTVLATIGKRLDEVDQVFAEENGLTFRRRTKDPDPGGIALGAGAPLVLTAQEQDEILEGRDEVQLAGLFERLLKPFLKVPVRLTGKAQVLSQISTGKIGKPRRRTWRNFYKQIIDDVSPLNDAVKDAIGKPARSALLTQDDPYKLARLNRGVNGKAEHFLEFSPFKFDTYENVGRSLKDILAPVSDRLDDIRAYAVAKRSIELNARGIETGVDGAAARTTVDDLEETMEPIFRDLVEFQNHVLDYLRDAGIVSEKAAKAMREANKDYVPFFRLMEDQVSGGGGATGKGMGVRQPVKRIKGSERVIIDPLESIVKNTYLYLNLADRNGIGLSLLRLADTHPNGDAIAKIVATPKAPTKVTGEEALRANPEIKQLLEQYGNDAGVNIRFEDFTVFRPNAMVVGPNEIVVYREGKRLLVEVDQEVASTFKALDTESASQLVKILSIPSKMLRAGAVLSPEFIGRNPIRDQLSAFIFSDKGFKPFLDLGRGVFHMIKKDDVFKDWIKSGGPMASLVSLDRTYLQKNIREIAGQTGLGERVLNVVKSPIEALRVLSDLAERGTRLGEFERVAGKVRGKEEILTAGFASREITLDFQRIGAKTRSVNALIAFWNANVQGQDKVIRSFKENPFRTTAKIGAGITLPSVTLQVINRKFHDDPDDPNGYSKLPAWVRDLFWNIKVGDTWWRLPKPFELGIVFGTGAERIVDYMLKRDPKAFDGFLAAMGRGASPGMMPTALTAPVEQFANRSLFSNRPIIPADRERVLPEYQYSQYTTELGKSLGKLIAQIPLVGDSRLASPAVIENYVRSWTGGLGTHIFHAADFALRKAGVLPDPPMPATTLADIPFVKGFIVRHPTAGAAPIQKFFDDYNLQQLKQNSIKALIAEGDADEAIKLTEQTLSEGDFIDATAINDALVTSMKTIRLIAKHPDITPDEKRQMIDNIYFQMIDMSALGNEMIREGREASKEIFDLEDTTVRDSPRRNPLEAP